MFGREGNFRGEDVGRLILSRVGQFFNIERQRVQTCKHYKYKICNSAKRIISEAEST